MTFYFILKMRDPAAVSAYRKVTRDKNIPTIRMEGRVSFVVFNGLKYFRLLSLKLGGWKSTPLRGSRLYVISRRRKKTSFPGGRINFPSTITECSIGQPDVTDIKFHVQHTQQSYGHMCEHREQTTAYTTLTSSRYLKV